jgi:cell volume regulation protein A
VFLSLSFFKSNLRSKIFVSWVGLRGSVPIVFATYPLLAGIEKADLIFNLVFFISVTSVLLQGTTLSYVASLLKVVVPPNAKRITDTDFELTDKIKTELQQIILKESSYAVGRRIVQLGIPSTVNIVAIQRGEVFIAPNGSTKLMEHDILHVLAKNKTALESVIEQLNRD